MRIIKRFLSKHQMLYFWGRVFQNCRYADYRQMVIDISEHPALVKVEKKGELHRDEAFYFVNIDDEGNNSGFFALLNNTIKRLELAKRLGVIPVIRWINTAYSEECLGENVFEYYFVEPCDISFEELNNCHNIIVSRTTDGFASNTEDMYLQMTENLAEVAEIYKRYIRLQEGIYDIIQHDICTLKIRFENVIGVHVRGTDYGAGWKGHPTMVSVEEYIEETKKMMHSLGVSEVFLATDDSRVIGSFESSFGNHLHYYNDVYRGDSDLGAHYSESERDKHHFKLGYEVLRDAYTLAMCTGFIGGMSQVGFAVRIINSAEFQLFSEVSIIDKGINKRGISSRNFNKKFKKRKKYE